MTRAGQALQRALARSAARQEAEPLSFADFVRQAWSVVDPAEVIWSWHLDVICDSLEELVTRRLDFGDDGGLVIAAPPGASKSIPVSILLQPWGWTRWPWSRWITTSYDDSLARRFSRQSRDLVRSRWYQDRWPRALSREADSSWANRNGGTRIAVGIGSRITGDHGHVLITDDPLKEQLSRIGTPMQIAQAVGRSTDYVFRTLASRAIDGRAARIVVQQRLHRDDPAGVALRAPHSWPGIVLPARYDPATAGHYDTRTEPGEYLSPRIDAEAILRAEYSMGPRGVRAQYEQDPQALGGAILAAEYLTHRWRHLPAELQQDLAAGRAGLGRNWITAWDLAFKGTASSDFVVGQLWCAWGGHFYLVDQVLGQWGFRESMAQLSLFTARHPVAARHIIEDAANAPALVDELASKVPGLLLAPVAGGCLARTQAIEGIWASGAVLLPASAHWVDAPDGFVSEHLLFTGDSTGRDDQVAASSLAVHHLRERADLPAWALAARGGRR